MCFTADEEGWETDATYRVSRCTSRGRACIVRWFRGDKEWVLLLAEVRERDGSDELTSHRCLLKHTTGF